MAETTEREKKETRSVGFTDGDYIPRNEAPNMPRVFSNADMAEAREPEKRRIPASLAVLLCGTFLFLGLWLGSGQYRGSDVAPAPTASDRPENTAANTARFSAQIVEPAADGEDRPCLGIAVQTVTPAAAEFYRLYCEDSAVVGAMIYTVGEDSAARQAGLEAGDILMALDGVALASAADLTAVESRYDAGDDAVCTVYRDGELLEVSVVFARRQPESADTEGLDW